MVQADGAEMAEVQGDDRLGREPVRDGHDHGIHEPEAQVGVALEAVPGGRQVRVVAPLDGPRARGQVGDEGLRRRGAAMATDQVVDLRMDDAVDQRGPIDRARQVDDALISGAAAAAGAAPQQG